MAGVFLSHSSKDKRWITRLAIDLVQAGFPVWFDSWELDTGDSLTERIFKGIDESTFLIVALSPNSVESRWVRDELNNALEKEQKLGRKVVLPIRLADCAIPESIKDRLYANFSGAYLPAFEELEELLRRLKADDADVPLSHRLLPLTFTNGFFLERTGLQKQFDKIAGLLKSGGRLEPEQVVIAPDERVERMRAQMLTVIEGIATDPQYSPEKELFLKSRYERIKKFERAIQLGVIDIANGVVELNEPSEFAEACHWYSRILRNEIINVLERCWTETHGERPPIVGALGNVLGTDSNAIKFYGLREVVMCEIFTKENKRCFPSWIDADSRTGKWFEINPQAPLPLYDEWSVDLVYKYLVPQMIAHHQIYNSSSIGLDWKLRQRLIGVV